MSSVDQKGKNLEKIYKSSTTLDFTIVAEDEPINMGTKSGYFKLTYGKADKCIKRKDLLYNREFLRRYPQYLEYLCDSCTSSISCFTSESFSSSYKNDKSSYYTSCYDCGCSTSDCSCLTCSCDSQCNYKPFDKNNKNTCNRNHLATFVQITDVHIIDPCNPGRVSFLAPFLSYDPAIADSFRPYEAFSTQVAECMVRKINAIEYGPHLKQKISLVINTGDNADSMSNNELTNFINILNGGPVIPNAAGKNYVGVQDDVPSEAYQFYYHPNPPPSGMTEDVYKVQFGYPDYPNILNEAMKPFIATGLKVPWYSCNGNHDVTKLGNYSLGFYKMRELFNSVSTGTIPNLGSKLIEGMTVFQAMEFAKALTFQDAEGALKIIEQSLLRDVPRSSKRIEFTRASFVSMHCNNVFCSRCSEGKCGATRRCDASRRECKENNCSCNSGLSSVRDCAEKNRCNKYNEEKHTDKENMKKMCHGYTQRNIDLNVLYYTFKIAERITGIMLDSCNPNGNLENQDLAPNGSIGSNQLAFLEEELKKRHSAYYNNQGELVKTDNKDELIIIFCHHTIDTMNNTFTSPTTFDNDPIRINGDEFKRVLWRYPNVVALTCGHTHTNNITFYPNPTGKSQGFVQINTASHIDWPQQSRILEIAENNNGTLSIFSTIINHLSPANVHRTEFPNKCCNTSFSSSHSTTSGCGESSEKSSEKVCQEKYNITEIASISRELSFNDPYVVNKFDEGEERSGTPLDRNVEIIIYNPLLRNKCKDKCKGEYKK